MTAVRRLLVLTLVFCFVAEPVAWASNNRGRRRQADSAPWKSADNWTTQTEGKLAYGLKNTFLGWTELFSEPYEAHKENKNLGAGVGEGLWNAVGQTAGGAFDLVTFPLPELSLPLPEGGVSF